jgi:hypothetical protein
VDLSNEGVSLTLFARAVSASRPELAIDCLMALDVSQSFADLTDRILPDCGWDNGGGHRGRHHSQE